MTGMRGIEELDHYEMLEVPRGATPVEIDRAYRMAQQTYADGSLALYSIFDKRDLGEIRARLDEAYRVLADPELRAGYDVDHGASPLAQGEAPWSTSKPAAPLLPASEPLAAAAAGRDDGEREEEAGGEFDGPRLRRTRLFRGYEIDQIADVTKVSGSHLRNIEDENFADLPAEVYVRGFVTAYAKTIGLDPVNVVPSYMARFQESRQKSQRSRFLGLR